MSSTQKAHAPRRGRLNALKSPRMMLSDFITRHPDGRVGVGGSIPAVIVRDND